MIADFALAASIFAFAAYVIVSVPPTLPVINFSESTAPLGVYRKAAVAADAGICSQVGADILRKNGSAVDSAIAAAICLGVIKMHNSGIGGGFFMTIWDQSEQKAYVLDAREMAPLKATENMFTENGGNISSTYGAFAIAVPGEVAGYWAAHQRFGKISWKSLFQPSIKMCREGFQVSTIVNEAALFWFENIAPLPDQKMFYFLKQHLTNTKTGQPYAAGDTIYCSTLADTLSKIADLGGPDFYNGSLAADILADLQEAGSPIKQADFSAYKPLWRKPVEVILQDRYRLISTPPPGSGAILGFILNILSGYNFNESSSQNPLTYHRFVEAFKFAYAKRTQLGDQSFVDGLDNLSAKLTSSDYGNYIRSRINDSFTQPTSYYDKDLKIASRDHGTAHVSVLDQFGNAASLTTTINTYFGSGVMGRRTGIIFNSEMDDFSSPALANHFNLPPSPNNFIRPGKRPQSSTCPSIFLVKDSHNQSTPILAIGGSGGSSITSAVAYITTRILWFKENVKQAIDALRFHHQLIPETLHYEIGMPAELLDALRAKGHVNQTEEPAFSDAQAVQRIQNGSLLAHSDIRKEVGYPDGF